MLRLQPDRSVRPVNVTTLHTNAPSITEGRLETSDRYLSVIASSGFSPRIVGREVLCLAPLFVFVFA